MNRKVLTVVFTLALFGLALVVPVWANQLPSSGSQVADVPSSGGAAIVTSVPSEMTVTVVRPVEIPGHTLEPGQYSFRLVDSDNAVAISKLDGSKFYGDYFIVPSTRGRSGDAAVYTAAAPDGLSRIASWYFPGEANGYSFVYPKTKHVQVAQAR